MRKFTFGIFLWFLVQIILMSATDASKTSVYQKPGTMPCAPIGPVTAYLVGAAVPITEFTFIKGEWCWQH